MKVNMILTGTMVFAVLSLAGCEHDVEEPGGGNGSELTFATVNREVFEPNCGSCHMGGAANGGLSMAGYNSLVNAPSMQKFGLDLIEPNDTAKSYLYLKITDDPSISGDHMPPGDMLPQDKIDLVAEWINAGAPEAAASAKSIISADNSILSQR